MRERDRESTRARGGERDRERGRKRERERRGVREEDGERRRGVLTLKMKGLLVHRDGESTIVLVVDTDNGSLETRRDRQRGTRHSLARCLSLLPRTRRSRGEGGREGGGREASMGDQQQNREGRKYCRANSPGSYTRQQKCVRLTVFITPAIAPTSSHAVRRQEKFVK